MNETNVYKLLMVDHEFVNRWYCKAIEQLKKASEVAENNNVYLEEAFKKFRDGDHRIFACVKLFMIYLNMANNEEFASELLSCSNTGPFLSFLVSEFSKLFLMLTTEGHCSTVSNRQAYPSALKFVVTVHDKLYDCVMNRVEINTKTH